MTKQKTNLYYWSMHYIQSYILDKLVYSATLRNRDMRPPDVESNLYQYHLQQLQREGFVQKVDIGYTLTGRGLAYADRHSTSLKKTRSQPKLITVIFITNSHGELLLVPRKRQPFMDTLNLPSGKIHLNETVAEAAARELQEKVDPKREFSGLRHFGVAHLTIRRDDFVISDYIALLLEVKVDDLDVSKGAIFCKIDDVYTLPLMPSVKELIDAFVSKSQFYEAAIEA